MKNNFWRELPRPFFILAPMEDVTDVVFRHVISIAARPDVFFTEFTNTESFCHPEGNMSVRGRLTFTEDEQPIVAHIWAWQNLGLVVWILIWAVRYQMWRPKGKEAV